MNQAKLIGITGGAGFGKDQLADALIARHGFVRANFGDHIKAFFDDFIKGEQTNEELEHKIYEHLTSQKTESDVQDFIHRYCEPYEAAGHRYSAHDPAHSHKALFRDILKFGGELVYDWLVEDYKRHLTRLLKSGVSCVNTRVCHPLGQPEEAQLIRDLGGRIYNLRCKHRDYESDWEREGVERLLWGNYGVISVDNYAQSGEDWANVLAPNYADVLVHITGPSIFAEPDRSQAA